jgi:hypothetical protein
LTFSDISTRFAAFDSRQGDHEARADVAPAGRHSDSGSIKRVGEANARKDDLQPPCPPRQLRGGHRVSGALRGSAKPILNAQELFLLQKKSAWVSIQIGVGNKRAVWGTSNWTPYLRKLNLIKYMADSIECAIFAHKNTFIMLNTYKQRVFVLINFSG